MNDVAFLAAAAAVRSWTHLYTRGLPEEQAARRRAEIESDLWECRTDPTVGEGRKTFALIVRLAAGASDDLSWRLEEMDVSDTVAFRRVIAAASFAGLAASAALSLALLSPARAEGRGAPAVNCRAVSAVPPCAAFSERIVVRGQALPELGARPPHLPIPGERRDPIRTACADRAARLPCTNAFTGDQP
jgi:hypothetical protein